MVPWLFITAVVFALLTATAFAVRIDKSDSDAVRGARIARVGFSMATAVLLGFGMFSVIPARSVGVPVSFGRPGDSMSNARLVCWPVR